MNEGIINYSKIENLKIMKRIQHYKKGFTLVEMIVALSIFMIFIGVAFSSYLHITRVQRDLNDIRKMYSEVRDLISMITNESREMAIDYDCYSGKEGVCFDIQFGETTNKTNALALISKDGLKRTIFRFLPQENGKVQVIRQQRDSESQIFQTLSRFDDNFADITFEDINIEDLAFVITPRKNPYFSENFALNQYQFQPETAIFLNVGKKFQTQPDFELNLETAVTSRVYSQVRSVGY